MGHKHSYRPSKQQDGSYLMTCLCHNSMTVAQTNRCLSEHTQLEALLDIERLASLIHDEWISWSKTLAEKKEVTPEKAKAWEKYWVPYGELSEGVKDMDREWAYKVADALKEGG